LGGFKRVWWEVEKDFDVLQEFDDEMRVVDGANDGGRGYNNGELMK
jgi:hypothetical protein